MKTQVRTARSSQCRSRDQLKQQLSEALASNTTVSKIENVEEILLDDPTLLLKVKNRIRKLQIIRN